MKLSPLTIIIIGLALGISVLSYAFFQQYQPNEEEAGYLTAYKEQLNTQAHQMPAAQRRLKKAQEMVEQKASQWREVVAVNTPEPNLQHGGINLAVNNYQLVVDSVKFRNSIQRAVNAQMHRGHVKIVTAPLIPQPTDSATQILSDFYNYPNIPFPVVIFNLGTVTVQGTYKQITEHVRAWARMPHYLAVADGLRIDGTSPNLTGTYNLSIVGYIRTPTVYGLPPEGSASTGQNGPGGGPQPQVGGPGINNSGRGSGANNAAK